ncbi:MAG: hypothetical protein JNL60_09475 [Bacteroidia bacterium]|nr:hypothetical protein [Bacteroidia bacterium]
MSLDLLLAKYDARISAIWLAASKLILDNINGVYEQSDLPANLMAYGLGPGYKGMICTLIFSKKQVKMGFNRGTELSDPSRLLSGSGKLHKYVALNSEADVKSPALKELLKEAETACRIRLKG